MAGERQTSVDACPGVFAAHEARDGWLVRVRLPGGALDGAGLRTMAECADDLGDGVLQLTSRANLQLRGLGTESGLAERLRSAGLVPAPRHERVRNFLASPGSGYFGGRHDVRGMVGELDRMVCARDELTKLPGRFLFALDDGRGDLADTRADVCWQALGDGAGPVPGALLLGGVDTGLRVAAADACATLVRCALSFVRLRENGHTDAWRVHELGSARWHLVGSAEPFAARDRGSGPGKEAVPPGERVSPGVFEQRDGRWALCLAPPLGALSAAQARLIAAEAGSVIVTPWRSVLVPDVAVGDVRRVAGRFGDAGLGIGGEPWHGVSACAGSAGCAKSHADVRSDATRAMRDVPAGSRVHFSGCERRCGRPAESHSDVLATAEGYRVNGTLIGADELARSLCEERPEGTV